MVEYNTIDQVDFAMMAAGIDYNAMIFRSQLDGISNGAARYGTLIGVNGDLETQKHTVH